MEKQPLTASCLQAAGVSEPAPRDTPGGLEEDGGESGEEEGLGRLIKFVSQEKFGPRSNRA